MITDRGARTPDHKVGPMSAVRWCGVIGERIRTMSDHQEQSSPSLPSAHNVSFPKALFGGAMAGLVTDISLYPLDTLKTRLQSSEGFVKSGGFRGIYRGLTVAAVGSAPGAALFFSSYETCKTLLPQLTSPTTPTPIIHMGAACVGEIIACLIRVPTEVVKQRYQANLLGTRSLKESLQAMKDWYQLYLVSNRRDLLAYEAALCGSISGGLAAACTTPLDVAKTRLMLGHDRHGKPYHGVIDTFQRLWIESKEAGPRGIRRVLFAGVEPRVMWISIGGFVFFGAYEFALRLVSSS
eukprot:scaffold107_cov207-Ochromonas_danica.AAC.1